MYLIVAEIRQELLANSDEENKNSARISKAIVRELLRKSLEGLT